MNASNQAVERRGLKFPLPARRTISQVVFDLPGVLYDDSEWKRWLLGLVTRMGLHTHYTPFFRLWNCEYRNDVACGRRDFWDALHEYLAASGLSVAQIDEVLTASRGRLHRFDEHLRAFAGVRPTLGKLAGMGTELLIVSRSPHTTSELEQTVRRLGLSECRARAIGVADVELVENASEFTRWFTQALACPTSTTAFVGRDHEDLAAARRTGILTVAFNHDSDAEADFYIEQFDQLVEIIANRGQQLLAAG